MGRDGTGTFTQSGGTNATNLYLGYNAGDRGTYVLSGTSQLSSFNQYVGYSGTGTLTQSGGAIRRTTSMSDIRERGP